MLKRVLSFVLAACMLMPLFGTFPVFAAVDSEEDILGKIDEIQTDYIPGKTYFVASSSVIWAGEENNIDGDKSQSCDSYIITNTHGRFGGLFQSSGFAAYVFNALYDEIPSFDFHGNPSMLSENIEVVGRYASKCNFLRGEVDGEVNVDNITELLGEALAGDILVVTPKRGCNGKGKAMVVTSVNESSVTVYQADYKGECAVTVDTIPFNAISDYHCVTLIRSKSYPYPQPVPPAAVDAASIILSGSEFSLNESLSLSWSDVKYADSYKAYLVDENGTAVSEAVCSSGIVSFLFDSAGTYRVKLIAVNEYGDSEAVYSDSVTVHNQNVVTFKDYDGTVITTQKVAYGADATAPHVPQRKGYQFAGWDKSLANVREPLEITATYEIEHYTVKYYDVGGQKFLGSETVDYMGKAKLRTDYTIDENYAFSGWQISFDSEGTDYNCVDGDMSLIATQKWANMNLPIAITASNVHRDENATYYSANLSLTNHDTKNSKNIKIIGTLKASDGKALKSVVLSELTIDANATVTLNDSRIVYSEKATTMEFVAVRMDGNSKTGGAASKTVSSSIVDDSKWGSWSDWTTADETALHDSYDYKTQYRYRNKNYTTSTVSWLSGWERYNTTSYSTAWSAWSQSYVSAFTNEAQTRTVESRYIAPTYKTQYHYFAYYSGSSAPWTHYSSSHPYYAEIWVDAQLPRVRDYGDGLYGYGGTGYDFGYPFNKWLICDGTTYGGPGPWTRQVQTGGGYTEYRYYDTYYTYYFWQWGNWSDWSDSYIAGDAVESRIVYRYRDQNENGDIEDTSGEFFKVEGAVDNVETDLNGLTAAVMVYKRSNTDPTEEQLEYVGEIVFGENNSYSFEFKPREMPDSDTGEFIVSLGIEGADRIVNIDVIDADLPKYSVEFIDGDGQKIEDPNAVEMTDSNGDLVTVQLVTEGESAVAPEPPEKEGYTFVRWSETLTGITSNKTIVAEYEPNNYTVVFIDWEKGTVDTEIMEYGTAIVYPALEAVEGTTGRAWDKQQEGVEVIKGNMIINSVAEVKTYTVTFTVDGESFEQTVKHGDAAVLPETVPISDGMIFADWTGGCSYRYITEDVTFIPSFMYSNTVSEPYFNVEYNGDGSRTVELVCDTEGAEIYYIVTSHADNVPTIGDIPAVGLQCEDEIVGGICTCDDAVSLMSDEIVAVASEDDFRSYAALYTGELSLTEDETVTFVAYADGMNDSIPVINEDDTGVTTYGISLAENTLRQYKSSIEGTLKVCITNEIPEYQIGTVSLCFYNQRDVLIDIIPMETDICPGENIVEFDNINIGGSAVSSADSVTCKVISSLYGEGIVPITDMIELEIE